MSKKIIDFSTNEIREQVEARFSQVYKAFSKYQDERNELWNICIKASTDHILMNHIIFINDNLQIPPVKVMISVYPEMLEKLQDHFDKKFIGAFWGCVFKEVFEYAGQKQVSINNQIVKTATYFSNDKDEIRVVENIH